MRITTSSDPSVAVAGAESLSQKYTPEPVTAKTPAATAFNARTVITIVFSILLGLKMGGLLIYALLLRPRMLVWGATPAEQAEALPGDEIVPQPDHVWTRAITIAAPPAAVWPWLVQLGQGRGGLYSYDWLENLLGCDIHSVDHILPELQHLAVGDEVRLVKPDYPVNLALQAGLVTPESALVLRAPGDKATALAQGLPFMSWAFILRTTSTPTGTPATRLIVRTRSTYSQNVGSLIANRYLLEPIQFIMERKMMLGIKTRAESLTHKSVPDPATQTAAEMT